MFTVIVPTMWKFEPFVQFLEDMTSAAPVNEILVINNNKQETPNHPVLNHPMINQIIPENNIFVNPAWNIGVREAKNDRVCIVNDDLIFDLKVFHRMWPHISPERGVYGISAGNVEMGQEPVTTGEIFVRHCTTPYHHSTHFGFGQFMMFNKNNYTPILNGLDIYWGDNFIYDTMYYKMNQNYQITNMFHYTPYASTVTKIPDHNERYQNEHRIYNQEMPVLLNKIRVENANRTGFY
jgi:hypothetical protein